MIGCPMSRRGLQKLRKRRSDEISKFMAITARTLPYTLDDTQWHSSMTLRKPHFLCGPEWRAGERPKFSRRVRAEEIYKASELATDRGLRNLVIG